MVEVQLESKNKTWGFYGTMLSNNSNNVVCVDKAWDVALNALVKLTGYNACIVRHFLDSRYGRHLADACYNKNIKDVIVANYTWVRKEIADKGYKVTDEEFYKD